MKKIQNISIIVLGIAITILSVGYALYGSEPTLAIPDTKETSNAWEVHFENAKQTENTNIEDTTRITPPSPSTTTSLAFGVRMHVGEVYEFTVDVKNAGTLNASVGDAIFSATKAESSESSSDTLVKYYVTYDNGDPIKKGDRLNAGDFARLRVHVEYVEGDNQPEEVEYQFKLNLNYVQIS